MLLLCDLLSPIALTTTFSKAQESCATVWIYSDVLDKGSPVQIGDLSGSSAIQALVCLLHRKHLEVGS